jgi:hypothetical protein
MSNRTIQTRRGGAMVALPLLLLGTILVSGTKSIAQTNPAYIRDYSSNRNMMNTDYRSPNEESSITNQISPNLPIAPSATPTTPTPNQP